MSIESGMLPNYLILCCPLLLLPSIFPSIRVISNELALHIMWPKDWSFSFSISPSREYSGFISFRINWFDLSVVQGTLKSLLQAQNSKASIILYAAFFMVKLSHMYMTTRKTTALTTWTFVGKVMSLLFNMISRFVIAFLPRSKLGESIILSAYKTLISIQVSLLRIHFFSILLQLLYNCVCPLQCVYEINKNFPKENTRLQHFFPTIEVLKEKITKKIIKINRYPPETLKFCSYT